LNPHQEAAEIQATLQTPGWQHIEAMLIEQASEPKDELWEIMSRKPDTLTGKSAIRLASRSAALNDFKESVYDRLKILVPTRKSGS